MKRIITTVLLSLFALAFFSGSALAEDSISVYRLYNNSTKEHLYTPSTLERDTLKSGGWQDEGLAWVSSTTGKNVYRLYNASTRAHLFTSDENEFKTLTSIGWSADFNGKPLFYSNGGVPVYRLYHEGIKQHLLTTDQNEYNTLPARGWRQEGISIYAVSLKPDSTTPSVPDTPSIPENPPESNKTLVAYFSATNNTENVAKTISDYLGADLYEITPEEPYTDADLNYSSSNSRTQREQGDKSVRPKISGSVDNMDQYSTIYLGYPIWFGQEPRIIDTFLESYNLNGKTIIPFCTSGSSGISTSESNIKALLPGANWVSGKRLVPNARDEIISFVESTKGVNYSSFNLEGARNGQAPVVKLNNGVSMPVFGLGTYSLTGDTCVNSVYTAIKEGYRLIDTAYMYGNEREVGEGVKKAIADGLIKREDIFVITKLYPSQYGNPEAAIEESLEKLDLGYIDQMMLHHPGTDEIKAYQAMEKYAREGKIRSLGLSNYYIKEIDAFLPKVNIKPVLVQNEIHPYYQERDVVRHIQSQGIAMQGWYPLGGRGHQTELLSDPVLMEIAKAHNKSVAQVILRWDLQNGVIVIPGSSNPDHIKENISIFDFKLSDEEMKRIDQLNRDEKHDWY